MNVVAMVTHSRPWLLKLNLEQLMIQPEVAKYDYIFSTDHGFHPDISKVIGWFAKETGASVLFHINPIRESPLPAFDNIMRLYRKAANHTDDYVIVLEEDIIPTRDYLRFNHTCYEKFLSKFDRLFCVCHKRRPETELEGKPEWLIGDKQLTSPSCISRKVIDKYICPELIHPHFFKNVIAYNQQVHPNHRNRPDVHVHHDGQLERIQDKHNMFSLKPDQARSMHIGVGGINCNSRKLYGDNEEKYNLFKAIIEDQDGESLREMEDNFKRDMCVAPLDVKWDNLFLDTTRTVATASSWSFDPENEFKEYIYQETINA